MCLGVQIRVPGMDAARLEALAATLRPHGPLRLDYDRGLLHISEEGGCACSLLADHTDWSAPTWVFRVDVLDSLARIIEALGAAVEGRTFSLEAAWIGDPIRSEEAVTAAELAHRIRGNALGQQARYHVVRPSTV